MPGFLIYFVFDSFMFLHRIRPYALNLGLVDCQYHGHNHHDITRRICLLPSGDERDPVVGDIVRNLFHVYKFHAC